MADDSITIFPGQDSISSDSAGDLELLQGIDIPVKNAGGDFKIFGGQDEVIDVGVTDTPLQEKRQSSVSVFPPPTTPPAPPPLTTPPAPQVSTVRTPAPAPKKKPSPAPIGVIEPPRFDHVDDAPGIHPVPPLRTTFPAISPPPKKIVSSAPAPKLSSSPVQAQKGFDIRKYAQGEIQNYLHTVKGIGDDRKPAENFSQSASSMVTPQTSVASEPKKDAVSQIIEAIIKDAVLQFDDPVLKQRFVSLTKSRLRDVRDKFEFIDSLVRPVKIGGLGFPEEKAAEIAEMVEHEAEVYLGVKEPGQKMVKKISPAVSPASSDTRLFSASSPASPYRQAITEKLSTLQQSRQQQSTSTRKPVPSTAVPGMQVSQTGAKETSSGKKPRPAPRRQVIRPVISSDRPTIQDVERPSSFRHNVLGPIEELARLDLANFRRLGVSADIRTQKIKEKIDVLEQDSFDMRTQGVDAWKASEVNKLYLEIGQESIMKGKQVAQVIVERQQQNMPTLSIEEFNAIADLNRMLRY